MRYSPVPILDVQTRIRWNSWLFRQLFPNAPIQVFADSSKAELKRESLGKVDAAVKDKCNLYAKRSFLA